MQEPVSLIVASPFPPSNIRQRHRIDTLYACRELVEAALKQAGCADIPAAWSATLEAAMNELAPFVALIALRILDGQPEIPKGIDHRPSKRLPWRARCWQGGKCVFDRSFSTLERAIVARAGFLMGRQ